MKRGISPSSIPVCRATTLAAFTNVLRDAGAPVDSALRRASLPAYFEERIDGWVPYVRYRHFIADMSHREDLPDLGTRPARSRGYAVNVHRGLSSATLAAPTLFNALTVLFQAVITQSSHVRMWFEPHGASVRVCHTHLVGPAVVGYDLIEDHTTMLVMDLVRCYIGRDWFPPAVYRRRLGGGRERAPLIAPDAAEVAELWLLEDHGGFDIPLDLIGARNPRRSPLAPMGELSAPPSSVADTLRSCLATYIADGRPTIAVAAELAGMSARTLQRALEYEATSYTEVLELARLDVALDLLEGTDMPLGEIALRLGYSEQSAFSRAFRAWTGRAPHTYRLRDAQPVGARTRVAA